jgi:hypothetical protein
LDELNQVVDLLELSQRVGVQVATAGQQMELLKQLRRLLGQQLATHLGRFDASTHGYVVDKVF